MAEQPPYANPDNLRPDSPAPVISRGWIRAMLYFVLITVVSILAEILFGLITSGIDNAGSLQHPARSTLSLVQLALAIGIAWLFSRFIDCRSLASLGFSLKSPFKRDLLAGCLWGMGVMTLPLVILAIPGQVRVEVGEATLATFIPLLLTLVFASAFEEVMLRGYVLRNLMDTIPPWMALIVVSILFSLLHLGNPELSTLGLINIVLAGVALGVYYIYRRNLWFPIGLHISWNVFQAAVYGIPVSGFHPPGLLKVSMSGSDILTGGTFGLEGSILTTFVLAIVIAAFYLIYRPEDSGPVEANS